MARLGFQRISGDAWLEFEKVAPAATFFATPAWAFAIHEVFPRLEPCPLSCELPDGRLAVIPFCRSRNRLGWVMLHGMPFDGYTVISANGAKLEAHDVAFVLDAALQQGDEVIINYW